PAELVGPLRFGDPAPDLPDDRERVHLDEFAHDRPGLTNARPKDQDPPEENDAALVVAHCPGAVVRGLLAELGPLAVRQTAGLPRVARDDLGIVRGLEGFYRHFWLTCPECRASA